MCCFQGMKPSRVHEIGPDDEPIIAWRTFKVTHFPSGTVTVKSPYRGTYWPKPSMRLSRGIAVRGSGGFYARKKKSMENSPYYNARAKVALRGRVVEYDDTEGGFQEGGYRAQECEILELHFDRAVFDADRLKSWRAGRNTSWLDVPFLLARK